MCTSRAPHDPPWPALELIAHLSGPDRSHAQNQFPPGADEETPAHCPGAGDPKRAGGLVAAVWLALCATRRWLISKRSRWTRAPKRPPIPPLGR